MAVGVGVAMGVAVGVAPAEETEATTDGNAVSGVYHVSLPRYREGRHVHTFCMMKAPSQEVRGGVFALPGSIV